MNSLLEYVLEAHGGLELWNRFLDLVTDVEIGGQICERKGLTGLMPRSRLFLSLREQRVVILLPGGQERSLIYPDRVSIVGGGGSQLASLADPRSALLQEGPDAPWDILRGAYFVGRTEWRHVTAPFLYTYPGFETEEIEPWHENGEIWRVLKVTFPRSIEPHTRIQYAYYGGDGLLRRHRCKIDILGGLDRAIYVRSYEKVNGIMMPTSRELLGCNANGRKVDGPPLVTIRLSSTFFSD